VGRLARAELEYAQGLGGVARALVRTNLGA
jgi:hypothetical protein